MTLLTVYTKPNCSQCEFAKKLIENNNFSDHIMIEYIDITKVIGAREKLIKDGIKSLPQFYIDHKLLTGGWEVFKNYSLQEILNAVSNG